jgi:hypothetical protein
MVSSAPGHSFIAWSSFLSRGNLWASFSEKTRQCWRYCDGSSVVFSVADVWASIAHCVAAVVRLISRICPSVWNFYDGFGSGVSGGVGRVSGGVSLVSLTAN